MKKPFPHTIVERHRDFMKNTQMRSSVSSDIPMDANTWYAEFFYNKRSWTYLTAGNYFESLSSSVSFDVSDAFSRMTREQYVKFWRFAITLLDQGAYPLPFDDCTFILDELTSVRIIRDSTTKNMAAFMMSGLSFVSDPEKVRGKEEIGEWSDTVVVGAVSRPQFLSRAFTTPPEAIPSNEVPLIDVFLSAEGLKFFHVVKGRSPEGNIVSFVAAALAINLMMMSPFTEVKNTPEPVKLNKQRVKKGKPTISESFCIKIRDHHQKPRVEPLDSVGTHASPSPHWRRGHLRQIRADYIVPVVPHVVGAAQGDVPEIGKKMYEMVCSDLKGSRRV